MDISIEKEKTHTPTSEAVRWRGRGQRTASLLSTPTATAPRTHCREANARPGCDSRCCGVIVKGNDPQGLQRASTAFLKRCCLCVRFANARGDCLWPGIGCCWSRAGKCLQMMGGLVGGALVGVGDLCGGGGGAVVCCGVLGARLGALGPPNRAISSGTRAVKWAPPALDLPNLGPPAKRGGRIGASTSPPTRAHGSRMD